MKKDSWVLFEKNGERRFGRITRVTEEIKEKSDETFLSVFIDLVTEDFTLCTILDHQIIEEVIEVDVYAYLAKKYKTSSLKKSD